MKTCPSCKAPTELAAHEERLFVWCSRCDWGRVHHKVRRMAVVEPVSIYYDCSDLPSHLLLRDHRRVQGDVFPERS